jgi:hypothetical protein
MFDGPILSSIWWLRGRGTDAAHRATMRTVIASFAVTLAACSAGYDSGNTPVLGVPPVDDEAPAPAAEPSKDTSLATLERAAYLVWGRDALAATTGDDGTVPSLDTGDEDGVSREREGETYALAADGSVIARVPFVALTVDGLVYQWSVRSVEVARTPCRDWIDGPDALRDIDPDMVKSLREAAQEEREELERDPTRKVDEASFVDLRSEQRHIAADFGADTGAQDFTYAVTLVGTVGRFAFLREKGWGYACGAHGSGGSSVHLLDLTAPLADRVSVTEEPVDALGNELPGEALAAARAEADEVFLERRKEWEGEEDGEADLVELRPHYGASGELSFDARFATLAPYAFSGGGWASYAIDTFAPLAKAVPARFAEFASAPDAVAAFVRAHPGFKVGGYTAQR